MFERKGVGKKDEFNFKVNQLKKMGGTCPPITYYQKGIIV